MPIQCGRVKVHWVAKRVDYFSSHTSYHCFGITEILLLGYKTNRQTALVPRPWSTASHLTWSLVKNSGATHGCSLACLCLSLRLRMHKSTIQRRKSSIIIISLCSSFLLQLRDGYMVATMPAKSRILVVTGCVYCRMMERHYMILSSGHLKEILVIISGLGLKHTFLSIWC